MQQRGADTVRYTPYERYCREVVKSFGTTLPVFQARALFTFGDDHERTLVTSPFCGCFMPSDHPGLQTIRDRYDLFFTPGGYGLMRQMESCLNNLILVGKEDYNKKKDAITILEDPDTGEQYKVNSRMLKVFDALDPLYGSRRGSSIITIWDSNPGKNLIHGCIALIR